MIGLNIAKRVVSSTSEVVSISRKVTLSGNMSIFSAIKSAVTSSGLEKPQYTVVSQQNDNIEERRYSAAKWVSTSVQGIDHEKACSMGFQRLFKYITGNNQSGTKVDMTAPVATRIVPGAGPNCENTFTVSFYIPPKHQENPPLPKDSDVFIEDWPERTILSRTFGGFASEESWLNEAKDMTQSIEKAGDKEKVSQNFWFTAGYNSPFQLFGRTNEVWFVKEEQT